MTKTELSFKANKFSNWSFTLYTIPNCPECERVKEILEKRKIPYREIDVKLMRTEFERFYLHTKEAGLKVEKERGSIKYPVIVREEVFQFKVDGNYLKILDSML